MWFTGIPGKVAAGQPWEDPADEAGLLLWLNETSITSAAGSVSAWNDLSGADRHFVQAVGASQPTETTLNALAAVIGDGAADHLACATGPALAGDFELLFAGLMIEENGYPFGSADGASGLLMSDSELLFVRLGGALVSSLSVPFAAVVVALSRASGVLSAEVNGLTAPVTSPNQAGTLSVEVLFGRTAAANFSGSTLGEVIVYDHRLSAGVRAAATAYLTAKWLS